LGEFGLASKETGQFKANGEPVDATVFREYSNVNIDCFPGRRFMKMSSEIFYSAPTTSWLLARRSLAITYIAKRKIAARFKCILHLSCNKIWL
jgi:hypothetical protein